jgi:hypothetical protein
VWHKDKWRTNSFVREPELLDNVNTLFYQVPLYLGTFGAMDSLVDNRYFFERPPLI